MPTLEEYRISEIRLKMLKLVDRLPYLPTEKLTVIDMLADAMKQTLKIGGDDEE